MAGSWDVMKEPPNIYLLWWTFTLQIQFVTKTMISAIITRGGGKGSGAFITGYKIQVKEEETNSWMWLTNAYTMTTVTFFLSHWNVCTHDTAWRVLYNAINFNNNSNLFMQCLGTDNVKHFIILLFMQQKCKLLWIKTHVWLTCVWYQTVKCSNSLQSFEGNSDDMTPHANRFPEVPAVSMIRISEFTFTGYKSLSLEIIGCALVPG